MGIIEAGLNKIEKLENKSIYILREAYSQFTPSALLWSIGKDSTAMLWIARKAFFGKIPFPVIHIDTGFKFDEIYQFRNTYAKKWGLNLIISKNSAAIKAGVTPKNEKLACCHALKTRALQNTINEMKLRSVILAIRRDEHGIRAKERYVSPRAHDFQWNYLNQPAEIWSAYNKNLENSEHARIHPMLHWTELDIWEYTQQENIPTVSLYKSRNGKRYRSIGCETCCAPVLSSAKTINQIIRELKNTKIAERSGRAQDKENTYTMQKLRSLGYM